MQSKTSFFNMPLFKKTIMRFWPIWSLCCIAGALGALIVLVETMRNGGRIEPVDVQEFYYSVAVYAVPIISMCYALVAAVCSWDYLYSTKSVVFYHSLPTSRAGMFATQFLAGMVIIIIPYAVTAILFSIEFIFFGVFSLSATMLTVLVVLAESFIFFSMATFVAHLTGFMPALALLYLVANFVAVLIEFISKLLLSYFIFGVDSVYNGKFNFLSPIVKLYTKVDVVRDTQEVYVDSVGGGYLTNETVGVHILGGSTIAWYTLTALILTVITFFVYKNRKSEAAGKVIIHDVVKNTLHVILTYVGAVCGGLLLATLLSAEDNPVVLACCVMFFSVISFYLVKMLMERTAKVFIKKNLVGCICMALACAAVCAAMGFDLFGVESKIPAKEKISRIAFSADGYNFEFKPGKDDTMVDEVISLHKAIVDNVGDIKKIQANPYDWNMDDGLFSTSVTYVYFLENGKRIDRHYNIPIMSDGSSDVSKQYLSVVNREEIMRDIMHMEDDFRLTYINVSYDDYNGTFYNETLSDENAVIVQESLVKDAKEGNWRPLSKPRYAAYDTNEDEWTMDIYMEYERLDDELSNDVHKYSEWDSVTAHVTPEMTNTLNALVEVGSIPVDIAEKIKNQK